MRDNYYIHLSIVFLLTIIAVNLLILDLKVFAPAPLRVSDISSVALPTPAILNNTCPGACLSLIDQKIKIQESNTNSVQTVALQQVKTARESYIPLGSGTTSKSEWDDISSTDTLIDPENYGNIKEAYFIASLKNPTQNGAVEAQLYNVTDKHLVWGSHVQLNGPISQTLTSSKIILDRGAKLYRVQLKSTLSFLASLDNAKIRIVSE